MKRILLTLVLILVLPHYSVAVTEESALESLAQHMLLGGNQSLRKLGAKVVYNEKISSQQTTEILVYHLNEGLSKESYNEDLLAWYAKAIGITGDARFYEILKVSYKKARSKKLQSHLRKSVKKLRKAKADKTLSLDSIDIDVIRSNVKALYQKNMKSDRSFDNLKVGDNIDVVLKQIGVPETHDQEIVFIRRPYVGSVATQRLILRYDQLGSLRLGYNDGQLTVERLTNSVVVPTDSVPSKYASLIEQIANGTPMEFRKAAREVYSERKYTEEVLDVAARRIWQDKNLTDDHAIDGMAILIKSIGLSANPRYRTFLSDVVNESKIKKIKKYANHTLDVLFEFEAEQFIP